jgi:hypothetical protein
MGFITKSYKKFVSERRRKVAPEIYQLREYDNKLWLTYQGGLVCPCDMLSMEPVEAVNKMRELYIERENQ